MTLAQRQEQQLAHRQRMFAHYVIVRAEKALRRVLTDGERRDLLKDSTNWTAGLIIDIVRTLPSTASRKEIEAGEGTHANS